MDDPVAWLFPGYKIGVLANRGPMKHSRNGKPPPIISAPKNGPSLFHVPLEYDHSPSGQRKKDTLRFDQLGDVRRAEQALRGQAIATQINKYKTQPMDKFASLTW